MEQKNYLMREIEKLTQLLKKLINLIDNISAENFKAEIKLVNNELTNELDLDLKSISEITETEFLQKIKGIDNTNLEILAKLLTKISLKANVLKKVKEVNLQELAKKTILLIDHIDGTSKTFSIERMNLKKELKHIIQ